MTRRLLTAAVLTALAASVTLTAQTITIARPGATPGTVDCARGCTVTINPPAPPCTYNVTPLTATAPAEGITVTATVQTGAGCAFDSATEVAWLTVVYDGATPNRVQVRVAPNTASTTRQGSVTIAGQTLVVTQAGVPTPPPPPPPPSGNVITRLDCSSGFPNCNWGRWGTDQHHTLSQVGNGARITLKQGTTQAQFYTGWGTNISVPADKTSLFVQMYLTVHRPFNPSAVGASGRTEVWTDKFLIINDGSNSSQRAIAELRPDMQNANVQLRFQRNIDGDEARTPLTTLPFEERVPVQFEVRRGANGRTAIWINSTDYARPTVTSPIFNFAITSFFNVRVGFYQNAALSAAGAVSYTVEDVKVTDSFDASFR